MTSQRKAELVEAYIRARLDKMMAEKEAAPEPVVEPAKPPVGVFMPKVKNSIYDADRVIAAVAIAHNVLPREILGRARPANIAWARHHATWILYNKTRMSLVTMAKATHRVCHTSVRHSIQTFEANKHRFTSEISTAEHELSK